VRLRVRPATEDTQQHHRRETFLHTLKAALRAAAYGGRPRAGSDATVTVGASPTNERKDEHLQVMLA
jgi:hypothetical protein